MNSDLVIWNIYRFTDVLEIVCGLGAQY